VAAWQAVPVLLVARLEKVADPAALAADAQVAFAALATRPGWVGGRLGQAVDDPECWVLTAEWTDVGSGRRGLTASVIRAAVMPLTSRFADEPCTFEIIARV
jgi:hypothetical protein